MLLQIQWNSRGAAPDKMVWRRTCNQPKGSERERDQRRVFDLYRFPTTGRPEVWAFKNSDQATPIKPFTILNDGEALASAANAFQINRSAAEVAEGSNLFKA